MSFVIPEWHPSLRSVTLAAIDSPPVRSFCGATFSPHGFAHTLARIKTIYRAYENFRLYVETDEIIRRARARELC